MLRNLQFCRHGTVWHFLRIVTLVVTTALSCTLSANVSESDDFRLDLRGLGPWKRRVAQPTETITYSTAWATNLTVAQEGEAKAVVKVNPCLKTPPKYLVVDMSGGRSAARWPISHLDEVPEGGWTDEYKTEKLVLRYIPAGSFIMGGRATDYPGAVNTNLHMVTLTKPFYIGVFECTQRQWELAMGTRPSAFSNETCYATRPVEMVSYVDIRGGVKGLLWPQSSEVDSGSFMGVLRSKVGIVSFDLPTEAQWEYACRAGTTTALYSGKNISIVNIPADGKSSPEILELGRCKGNSGWHTDYRDLYAADSRAGTAQVGSYPANPNDLYDMCGNVQELCLDVYDDVLIGSIDPVGPNRVDGENHHPYRGGSWGNNDHCYTSSNRGIRDVPEGRRVNNVGLRVCVGGGDFVDAAETTVLVNASGADAADWTPTEVGTYQLTHEVQMDGVTVGAMESALFKVEGPELFVKANGELLPGVEVEVDSSFAKATEAGSGEWTIYYTLDGSEPTAESALYNGPFALEESATVRAVAISEAGVRSDEARVDFTLHDAMSVVGAVARQRYPWNGMVDIDCEITGDSNRVYAVEVTATDLDGGTNLPVRTVHMAARPESAPYRLAPGKYRFTWNADADIAGDFDFANVSVSVSAKSGPLVGYARQMTISTDGYAGSETLTNVPVLVRFSTSIAGFDYNDFASPSNGADMVFMDESETQVLPYEIDEWHTNGESLVWVKLPELKRGTKFKLAYGGSEHLNHSTSQPLNSAPHEVWREYAGVWHMNEDSGTAFDSTEHGLDALPDCGVNGDISQMVAYENGACGRARVNADESLAGLDSGTYMLVPSYDALGLGGSFAMSVWFHGNVTKPYPRLASRKLIHDDATGWETWVGGLTQYNTLIGTHGSGYGDVIASIPDQSELWVNVTWLFSTNIATCYVNGQYATNGVIVTVKDNGLPLTFGHNPSLTSVCYVGQYDEIRLRGGTLSADRIKADYDMIANKNFCTYEMITVDSQKE